MAERKVTQELKQAIIDAYQSEIVGGKTIARKFGLGAATVYRVLRRNNVPRRRDYSHLQKNHRRFDDDTEMIIAKEYLGGKACETLAKKWNVCSVTIAQIVRRRGFKVRRRGGLLRSFTEEQIQRIIAQRKEGRSQEAIAEQLGISQVTLSHLLRRLGYPSRCNPLRTGGRKRSPAGYVYVLLQPEDRFYSMATANGYVFEHRYLMAQKLGRPLAASETVHHINGIRDDNRIENLQLRSGKHGNGVSYECQECGSTNVKAVRIQ